MNAIEASPPAIPIFPANSENLRAIAKANIGFQQRMLMHRVSHSYDAHTDMWSSVLTEPQHSLIESLDGYVSMRLNPDDKLILAIEVMPYSDFMQQGEQQRRLIELLLNASRHGREQFDHAVALQKHIMGLLGQNS